MPEKDLQDRWFSEPLHYLTWNPGSFQFNKAGHPALTRYHQEMVFRYMRLKSSPWHLLCDLGPYLSSSPANGGLQQGGAFSPTDGDFPTLAESKEKEIAQASIPSGRLYINYLRWLELQQQPLTYLERTTLTSFQDWLQSPLQPLSDNLESATYEIFEGDPVKYNQYELAIIQALSEWDDKPTSSPSGAVVIAVAGSGRGPLVTRALKASEYTGVPVEVWAVEKNPNAYVYLLRTNEVVWGGCVNVVKTDMRSWKGPLVSGNAGKDPVYGTVDILISELLGSFADNELSPECLDGIQHVLAKPYGISIPSSYTAHLTPIATPRIHTDLLTRVPTDPNAFETPWVVMLYALDFVSQRVPDHPRFQQAWEFSHPLPESTLSLIEARRSGGVVGGGGGSMAGAAGANDHNSRYCHLTFVCRTRGVIHGLAGYFEATLYESELGEGQKVEISTLPDMIDRKSKDMISWFPIFFPVKVCHMAPECVRVPCVFHANRNSNPFTSLQIPSSKLACGDRRTIGRYGTNGSLRRIPGSARNRGLRLALPSYAAAGKWPALCDGQKRAVVGGRTPLSCMISSRRFLATWVSKLT
jgi:type II protein arginine methyltransferase